MSKGREIADYLGDILNAIVEVEEFTRGMSYDAFISGQANNKCRDQES